MSVYYKWVESMMECVGVKDRPDIGIPVTPLEMAFLDSVIRSFIKSISDFDINKDMLLVKYRRCLQGTPPTK